MSLPVWNFWAVRKEIKIDFVNKMTKFLMVVIGGLSKRACKAGVLHGGKAVS